jgi:hypothetical protein
MVSARVRQGGGVNPQLEQALVRDFPALFRDYGCAPQQSCMAFGCDVGDGWEPLIRRACEQLAALGIPSITLSQVKEKWGCLVIYTSHDGDDRVYEITRAAEDASETVCEQCGQPGTLKMTGWYRATCDTCEAKRLSDTESPRW